MIQGEDLDVLACRPLVRGHHPRSVQDLDSGRGQADRQAAPGRSSPATPRRKMPGTLVVCTHEAKVNLPPMAEATEGAFPVTKVVQHLNQLALRT